MKIVDIAFVCYAVGDLKKSRAFYEGVLGLKATKTYLTPDETMGLIEYDIGPATLAIGCGAPTFNPGGGTNVTAALEVEDFEAAVKRLKEHQVSFTMEPTEHPPCSMALVSDPDGNPLMIHRRKDR